MTRSQIPSQFCVFVRKDGSAELILGTVSRGYPKPPVPSVYFSFAECSASYPWSATPLVAEEMEEDARRTLPVGGTKWGRLGPFKTRREALEALEDWWLRRLGVTADGPA